VIKKLTTDYINIKLNQIDCCGVFSILGRHGKVTINDNNITGESTENRVGFIVGCDYGELFKVIKDIVLYDNYYILTPSELVGAYKYLQYCEVNVYDRVLRSNQFADKTSGVSFLVIRKDFYDKLFEELESLEDREVPFRYYIDIKNDNIETKVDDV
jgi:hypothetical protein